MMISRELRIKSIRESTRLKRQKKKRMRLKIEIVKFNLVKVKMMRDR
jgi:hypothetical protein